jgi:hypothetical protein
VGRRAGVTARGVSPKHLARAYLVADRIATLLPQHAEAARQRDDLAARMRRLSSSGARWGPS